jgi:hypothetical protein
MLSAQPFDESVVKSDPSTVYFSRPTALGEGKKIDSDSVKQAADKLGVETVLVTHLLGVEEKKDFSPGGSVDLAPYESLSNEYKELAGKYHSEYTLTLHKIDINLLHIINMI